LYQRVSSGAYMLSSDVKTAALRLAAIVAAADEAIVYNDLDRRITSWNRAADAMLGYSSDEIVGKPLLTIIPPDPTLGRSGRARAYSPRRNR
jgi:PAS domain S-box-containing protein